MIRPFSTYISQSVFYLQSSFRATRSHIQTLPRRQDNVNPVDGVERSTLILASTVHSHPAVDLIRPEHVPAARARTPALFAGALEDE